MIALIVVLDPHCRGRRICLHPELVRPSRPRATVEPPAEDVEVAEPDAVDRRPEVETPGNNSTLIPEDVAEQDPLPEPPVDTTTCATRLPVDTVEPEVTEPDIQVADVEEPVGEIPPLEGVPAMLAWVNAYQLGSCEFAQALTADERSMSIEAFGTEVPPFETMMIEFEAENGFEPDILMRMATAPQCAAVDFLRFVKPLAEVGPRLDRRQHARRARRPAHRKARGNLRLADRPPAGRRCRHRSQREFNPERIRLIGHLRGAAKLERAR